MLGVVRSVKQLSSIEEHDLSSDGGKCVDYFEILKRFVLWENFFEKNTKSGYVPLPVAEVINELLQRLLGRYAEGLIEGAAGRSDSKLAVKDEQWLAYRIDDGLGVRQRVS
jgi:hypothetical protein